MSESTGFPRSTYSKKDVKQAGQLLAQELILTDETAPGIVEAFKIANDWRDSHAFPMRSVRYQVLFAMRRLGVDGISAARLKRMKAIRMKLRRGNVPF